ncbi:MAG: nucleotidyltransferase family protein [Deltaproteobacteria bacterium]|uniref:Nucleotidyltransferase family protein n=1 Tax=Candidatus Zymogenus saltonus TaxID=2844893 RepID=A0A9D8KDN8_9DELT|nr:nucleotidyltransferase family protein [Candidatus Zymogenus saltonus]
MARFLSAAEIIRLALISRWAGKGISASLPQIDRLPGNLIPFAVDKGSLGILITALTDWGLLPLLADAEIKRARTTLARTELLNMAMRRELEAIFKMFNDGGVRAVLIKGHDLINRYYKDFRIRPSTDADILIHQKDFGAAAEIFKGAGYEPFSAEPEGEIPAHWSKGSLYIDLHTKIIDEGRIRSREYLPTLSTDEIFASAEKIKIGDADYLSTNPYHTIIISSHHALKHSYLMNYWFMDVGRVIESLGEGFSLGLLFDNAGSNKLIKIVGRMLWILTERFGFPLNSDEVSGFKPGPIERRLVSAAIGSRRSLQFGDILLGLNIDNSRQKLYYYRELLFPEWRVLLREGGSGAEHGKSGKIYFSRTIHLLKSLFGIIFRRKE